MSSRGIIPVEGCAEIARVAIARLNLPTDVELARKYRVSRRRIQQLMKRVREFAIVRSCVVDTTPPGVHIAGSCQPHPPNHSPP